jgi:CDP-diacylglycerol--serine O-phosphatidyltransferase
VTSLPSDSRSLLRSLVAADFLTLGNASCGTTTIFLCLNYLEGGPNDGFLVAAFLLLPLALALDVADGLVARGTHRSSAFGADLDSLADVISFGVAPASLAFAAGMHGGWDAAALMFFVCCGVSRLARYNVTAEALSEGGDKVRYFEGTPIPTSVVLTAVLAFAGWQGRLGEDLYFGAYTLGPWVLHPLSLMFVLSGSLMISKTLRIPKP